MSGITLASKGYVDDKFNNRVYYGGNIGQPGGSPTPKPLKNMFEFNFNQKWPVSALATITHYCWPTIRVPDSDEASYIGLENISGGKIYMMSEKTYETGTHHNVLLKIFPEHNPFINIPLGPDETTTGWMDDNMPGRLALYKKDIVEGQETYIKIKELNTRGEANASTPVYTWKASSPEQEFYPFIRFNISPYRDQLFSNITFRYIITPLETDSTRNNTQLASVSYVNSKAGVETVDDVLATVNYADNMWDIFPEDCKPYQPNLT